MKGSETICLPNDSFPPLYDGVAMANLDYANSLRAAGYDAQETALI